MPLVELPNWLKNRHFETAMRAASAVAFAELFCCLHTRLADQSNQVANVPFDSLDLDSAVWQLAHSEVQYPEYAAEGTFKTAARPLMVKHTAFF